MSLLPDKVKENRDRRVCSLAHEKGVDEEANEGCPPCCLTQSTCILNWKNATATFSFRTLGNEKF